MIRDHPRGMDLMDCHDIRRGLGVTGAEVVIDEIQAAK